MTTRRESMFDRCDPWCDAEEWLNRLAAPCFVYFVQSGDAVKVGKAIQPWDRVAELQCGNPAPLKLLQLVPGDHELETRFHRWLRPHCIRGEWFEGPEVAKALEFATTFRNRIVEAYDGGSEAPEWRGLMTWPRQSLNVHKPKPRREPAPVTVRKVEPDPVPPEVVEQRWHDLCLKPRRPGERLDRPSRRI